MLACTSYATQIDLRFGDAMGNCLHFGIGVRSDNFMRERFRFCTQGSI